MRWLMILLLLMATGCQNTEEEPKNREVTAPESSTRPQQDLIDRGEVLASHLNVPWDVIKEGEQFFISLRGGEIVKVGANGEKTTMPLQLSTPVVHYGEGGLLGFVLHPNYSSNQLAYIYHTYRDNGQVLNRIVQIKNMGEKWIEQQVLLSGIPGSAIHNGGRLEIGPDGKLYATTGDAGNPEKAQDLNSLSGKILRLNLDGSVPQDNPFSDSYVYTYGHRNPQGMAWSREGEMYAAEHGSSAHDEINKIIAGHNYGWPVIQGDEQQQNMETPLFHSGETTWAPSGIAYYKGRLYMAGLGGEQIRVFDLEEHSTHAVFENVGRIRDILIEDDAMYILTNETDGRGSPDEDDDHLIKLDLPLES